MNPRPLPSKPLPTAGEVCINIPTPQAQRPLTRSFRPRSPVWKREDNPSPYLLAMPGQIQQQIGESVSIRCTPGGGRTANLVAPKGDWKSSRRLLRITAGYVYGRSELISCGFIPWTGRFALPDRRCGNRICIRLAIAPDAATVSSAQAGHEQICDDGAQRFRSHVFAWLIPGINVRQHAEQDHAELLLGKVVAQQAGRLRVTNQYAHA